jgi:membrane protein DedA with SNARE-associated domain
VTFSIVGSLVNFITWVLTTVGIPGLAALMVVESFGVPPMPSEIILTFAGFLVAEGVFPFWEALLAALAGQMIGSYLAYGVGRWGRHWLTSPKLGAVRIKESQLQRFERWFAKRGEYAVLISRVTPIIRSYVSFPAGTAKMSPSRFGVYTLVGSIPWTVALLYAGIVLRSNWDSISKTFEILDIIFVTLIGLLAIYVVLRWQGKISPGWPPRRVRPAPSGPSDAP